jgi:ABC-type transport system substrate-binding protein
MHSYWSSLARKRTRRREALVLAGSAAAGSAFLAACGNDDDDTSTGSSATSASGSASLVTPPVDTFGQATKGGVLKYFISTDVGGWDVHTRGRWFGTLAALLWQRLTTVQYGAGRPPAGEMAGDLAEGWEASGDGTTVTFKLRPGGHFNNVPPVHGHEVEAEDVVATWDRWREVALTRATIDNAVNPDAPVVSMNAQDNRTVVMNLAFPAVALPSLFSAAVGQGFLITPREIGDYDPREVAIGSGPFQVKEHVSSAYIHTERNPGYVDSKVPYFDGIEMPIISEYASGLAALKSGQLHTYPVRPEEILTTKQEQSKLNIYQSRITVPTASMFFGYRPGSAFLDERLRQAFSMTQDRDLFSEVWFDVAAFDRNGLPVETLWNTSVPADEFSGWLLNPKSPDFGENAKYFEHNIEEAKKLMSAAGHPDGLEYPSTFASDTYGPEYQRQIEIQEGMAAEAGFRAIPHGVIYQSDLIPNYQSTRGEFDGTGWMLRPQSSTDPIDKFAEYNFSGSGPNFIGYDAAGKGDHSGDPYVDDLIRKGRTEPDMEERVKILHDLQRHFAKKTYLLRAPTAATSFDILWPAVKNYMWVQSIRVSEEMPYWWLDRTQAPGA